VNAWMLLLRQSIRSSPRADGTTSRMSIIQVIKQEAAVVLHQNLCRVPLHVRTEISKGASTKEDGTSTGNSRATIFRIETRHKEMHQPVNRLRCTKCQSNATYTLVWRLPPQKLAQHGRRHCSESNVKQNDKIGVLFVFSRGISGYLDGRNCE